ncbi:hypothetical protein [Planotetraspora kaengkrachanensis]|uniref:Uncharacterized protein n=1 Tax=Planotetraspora kaengkrachanensis TaxID=575193 RepID=A0A8J3PYC9_9ACTN|nr:hypothetical protein [Planotetraspora kaengkrachanensis]GIG83166.1 hypothetical protein Pka01_62930 [Planotetraspora kaengkrachanensis]
MSSARPEAAPHDQDGEAADLIPPDPTGLEAWIRQVLGLAGPRVSSFVPLLPDAPGPSAEAEPPPSPQAR